MVYSKTHSIGLGMAIAPFRRHAVAIPWPDVGSTEAIAARSCSLARGLPQVVSGGTLMLIPIWRSRLLPGLNYIEHLYEFETMVGTASSDLHSTTHACLASCVTPTCPIWCSSCGMTALPWSQGNPKTKIKKKNKKTSKKMEINCGSRSDDIC